MNAHTPILKPLGMPKGMDPRAWRQSVEKRLNDLLDRAMSLITALDLMEVDCDLEGTADDEPSLAGAASDLEGDDSDYELGGDEETQTWGETCSQGADAWRRTFTGEQPR
jgi:hypothetical protein